jgi:predicted dehydrogenase
MRPVKLAMIGCGIAARNLHLPALRQLGSKFEIALLCNNGEHKARALSEETGGTPYVRDYAAVLDNPTIEAVDIALPIHLNYAVTQAALGAGKHVFVEKPMAANLGEAEEMRGWPASYPDLVMMVGENFYYHTAFHRIKALLDAGQIGEPYAVFWDVFRYVDLNNRYAKTRWRRQHQYPGGFITDGGVHNIAALRLLFGSFRNGQAFIKTINREIGEVDSFSFQFEMETGVHGVLNIFVSANGAFKNDIRILGKDGSMLIENNRELQVLRNGETVLRESLGDDLSYRSEFEDFYAGIREGKQIESSFERGYQDLRVILKALETADRWHGLSL